MTLSNRSSSMMRRSALVLVGALFLFSSTLVSLPGTTFSIKFGTLPTVDAKEIVATHEWQLLSDNDTVPAGLHVRMDLSTGQKWAKLVSDEKRDDGIKAAVHDSQKVDNLSKVETAEMDSAGTLTVVETSDVEASDEGAGDDA